MGFKRDFAKGKKGEKVVAKLLENCNIECTKNEDKEKLKDYDLVCKLGKKKFTVEIKFDWLCEKTGNVAIEYYNSSKDEDSGIAGTKATLWAQVITDQGNNTVWLANVKALKKFIKNNTPCRTLENVGDGNACIYLYKENKVLDIIFIRVDNINNDKRLQIIKNLIK